MQMNSKITADHLKRIAYLYVRQSTVRQVFENTESTKRQYALRQRAIALGWPAERIEVIDTDLGQSGSTSVDRQGFQKLVAEVGEAETHLLRARLRGGLLNKARRGELRCHLPIGLVYNPDSQVALDSDRQIQQSIHLLFETFFRTGTAHRTSKHFRDNGLLFPRRVLSGADKGKVIWGPLTVKRVL